MSWKGICAILCQLPFPAPKVTLTDAQLSFNLRGALVACFQQAECLKLEFTSVVSPDLFRGKDSS